MKIGFSSRVCPEWDLETMAGKASALGFDGIEVWIDGDLPLPASLRDAPGKARDILAGHNADLLCLSSSATLDSYSRRELSEHEAIVHKQIELASALGCPRVRIAAGRAQLVDHHRAALARVADSLQTLVPVASEHGVALTVENGGDFIGSQDAWYLAEAAGHPAYRVCWNQCTAMGVRERATVSIPRLSSKIGVLRICDADFDTEGRRIEFKNPGQGQAEIALQIELLKGLACDPDLVFDWPREKVASLPAADAVLPDVAKFLRECLEAKQGILTAYKTDKRPAKFAARAQVAGAEGA